MKNARVGLLGPPSPLPLDKAVFGRGMTNDMAERALAQGQQRPSAPHLRNSQVGARDKGSFCVLWGLEHSGFWS